MAKNQAGVLTIACNRCEAQEKFYHSTKHAVGQQRRYQLAIELLVMLF